MVFWLISIFLMIPYAWLILYYRRSWLQIPEYQPTKALEPIELPFISIIIAARNEEKNIGDCIRSIIAQTYPKNKFEIIIVDDHSTDSTVSIIQSFQNENIRLLHLSDFIKAEELNSYKKKSIGTALQFANGELIVTTDADCTASPQWIETLAAFYEEKSPVFVALLVAFKNPSKKDGFFKRFFKIFQALDFMALQGITGASVFKKIHAMCNGANLAYQKKVFYEAGGFDGIDKIASGDDMLLMQKIQSLYPDKTLFLKSKNIIVETKPAEDLQEFLDQRIRWASKADSYTDKKITSVLLLVYLLNLWIFIVGISSFFFLKSFYFFLILIAIKILVELIFLYPVAKFFGKEKLLWWFIPAQPFHIFYTLIAGWLGKFGSYRWKGRNVK